MAALDCQEVRHNSTLAQLCWFLGPTGAHGMVVHRRSTTATSSMASQVCRHVVQRHVWPGAGRDRRMLSSVDGLSPATDLSITMDPSHLSRDGLPMVDVDTFSKLLAEVRLHNIFIAGDKVADSGLALALSRLFQEKLPLLNVDAVSKLLAEAHLYHSSLKIRMSTKVILILL